MPRCKEAAVGPSEYSRRRVRSPLDDLTAWHKKSALVIRPPHRLGQLSQSCDSQTCEIKQIKQTTSYTFYLPVSHLKGQNMEVPLMMWADIICIMLCFAAVVLCEKVWRWIQRIEIKVDKQAHQVSLPELVMNLVHIQEQVKPEEETKKFVDALEQSEVMRPKILAMPKRDPNKDGRVDESGMQQLPDEWDSMPGQLTYTESTTTELPSYASMSGRGIPVVYDWEGLSEVQQITLENMRRCQARNQRHRRERARQGSDNDENKDESPEGEMRQENQELEVSGRGRASIRARPRPATNSFDRDQSRHIPAGYEDTYRPCPYDFITANVEEHYHRNRPQR